MTTDAPTVTVLYVGGCTAWRLAAERVCDALEQVGLAVEPWLRRVRGHRDALALAFPGSPTILVDGRDPFATGVERVGMRRRLYPTPAGLRAAPTTAMLREALTG